MGVNQNTHPCITQGNTHLLDGVKKNTPHCNTQANKHLLDEDRPEHTPYIIVFALIISTEGQNLDKNYIYSNIIFICLNPVLLVLGFGQVG